MTNSLRKIWTDFLQRPVSPTWDITQSYFWNFENGPLFKAEIPPRPMADKPRRLLDFTLNSPVGVAAGPLLNSKWIKLYAELGFDILTYKTVRTKARESFLEPNIVFVEMGEPFEPSYLPDTVQTGVMPKDISEITITNSFGMPSPAPEYWQQDLRRAKSFLGKGQLLIVSVVGTDEGMGLEELAADFAQCATLAANAGADIVEANLSCPTVSSMEARLYLDPDAALTIVGSIRKAIENVPLAVKLGYFPHIDFMVELVKQIGPLIDVLVAINATSAKVVDASGHPALPGRVTSGICGARIRKLGLQTVAKLNQTRQESGLDFKIIGCGGISKVSHAKEYLEIGADAVEVATAAIWNPYLALQFAMSDAMR